MTKFNICTFLQVQKDMEMAEQQPALAEVQKEKRKEKLRIPVEKPRTRLRQRTS